MTLQQAAQHCLANSEHPNLCLQVWQDSKGSLLQCKPQFLPSRCGAAVADIRCVLAGPACLSSPCAGRPSLGVLLQKAVAGAAQQQTEQLSPPADALRGAAGVAQLYRSPGLSASQARTLLRQVQAKVSSNISGLDSELVSAPAGVCGGAAPRMRQ